MSGSWEPRADVGGRGGDAADAAGGVGLSRGHSYESASSSLSQSADSKLEPPPSPDEYAAFRTLEESAQKGIRQAGDVYANADALYR